MKVSGKHYRTIWMEGSSVFMIDQNALPFEFRIFEARTCLETCQAIRSMITRGAGAIGAAAGFAMAQAILEAGAGHEEQEGENVGFRISDFGIGVTETWDTNSAIGEIVLNPQHRTLNARKTIESTRPTARNLFFATEKVFNAGLISAEEAYTEAQRLANENIEDARRIGEYGNELIKDGASILTHCNAGWLGFVDYGSALSPVYIAHQQGKKLHVYADETRPRSQGARLTAWELLNEGIPHTIVPDNAGAYLMSKGLIDLVIVGADRIAANGDTANKIGTFEKAIVAKEFGIPFYIAAPISTFDFSIPDGSHIPIEERSEDEVHFQTGPDEDGTLRRTRVTAPGSNAFNPAFDVTPASYITGIITEKGIVPPTMDDIRTLAG
jgi:methylthioribose-1-phosphate isomerase